MGIEPRRPSKPLITKVLAFRIACVSLLMTMVTFTVFEWELARGNSIEVARTAAVNMILTLRLAKFLAVEAEKSVLRRLHVRSM